MSYIHINLDTLRTRKKESALLAECLAEGYRVEGYFFQSILSDCIERNNNRKDKSKIPNNAIISKSKELEMPCVDEGFDALYFVKLDDGKFIVEKWRDEI